MRVDEPTLKSSSAGNSMILPRVLLATATASNDATVELSFDGFDRYLIVIQNISQTSAAGLDLYARFSSDGGATFSSASEYYWNVAGAWTAGTFQIDEAASADAEMVMNYAGTNARHGNANNEKGTYEIIIQDVGSATSYPIMTYRLHNLTALSGVIGTHYGVVGRKVFEKVNAVQFLFSSGNIDSGEFRLYGYPI